MSARAALYHTITAGQSELKEQIAMLRQVGYAEAAKPADVAAVQATLWEANQIRRAMAQPTGQIPAPAPDFDPSILVKMVTEFLWHRHGVAATVGPDNIDAVMLASENFLRTMHVHPTTVPPPPGAPGRPVTYQHQQQHHQET